MSTIIGGSSPSITFSDSTTQTTAFTGSASQITSGTLPSAQLPTGSVLQVVQGTATSTVTTSSNVYVDTGLTASITPKFSTSKILVIINHNENFKSNANANNSIALRLFRNSTSINQIANSLGYQPSATGMVMSISACYLDSPATTSATTYKTQFANVDGNAASVQVQADSIPSTITLMEIAG